MSRPVASYHRSSKFAWLALLAGCGALLSAYLGQNLVLSILTCSFFTLPALLMAYLACQPDVYLFDTHFAVGKRTYTWADVVKLDHRNWIVPLVVRLTLVNGERRFVLFPGDKNTGVELLERLRRMSTMALLDGTPYGEFWQQENEQRPPLNLSALMGLQAAANDHVINDDMINGNINGNDASGRPNAKLAETAAPNLAKSKDDATSPRLRFLSVEDEREVEQMYQRLKSVGHLESPVRDSDD